MDIKKERLEEIVKEELESFYEGEVPMEEGPGDKLSAVMKALTKGAKQVAGKYTPKDPGLEAEKEEAAAEQRRKLAQVGLAMDIRNRPVDFSKMSKIQKKAYLSNLAKLKSEQSEV
tara:strand:+ start:608 stop:955 length:348 start_codon:yes stop_codon:yes gene_type:complete